MKTIQNAIRSLGGHTSPEGFSVLCLTVYDARLYQPQVPLMQSLWIRIGPKIHKSVSATAKALERAVYEICTTADKDALAAIQRSWAYEVPKPKDFVLTMAQVLWDGVDRSDSIAG